MIVSMFHEPKYGLPVLNPVWYDYREGAIAIKTDLNLSWFKIKNKLDIFL